MPDNLVITTLIAFLIPSAIAWGAFRLQNGLRSAGHAITFRGGSTARVAPSADNALRPEIDYGQSQRAMPPIPNHELRLAKVEYIQDCCTLLARTKTEKIWLRLHGLDGPGNGQPWSDVAARGLNRLIGGRQIAFEQHATDQQGRSFSTIYVRDADDKAWQNVNTAMLARGHAWVDPKSELFDSDRRAEFVRAEQQARIEMRGIWSFGVRRKSVN